MSAFHDRFTAARTARFLRELEGPSASAQWITQFGSGATRLPEHRDRSAPRLVAGVAAVLSIVLVALTLWQSLMVVNG